MVKHLDVYLYEKLVGEYIQDEDGQSQFRYAEGWLHEHDAIGISCSLPLREKIFTQRECRPFFSGLLPEDVQRKVISKVLGISEKNDYKLLERIGGECAGAITFMPAGTKLSVSSENQYRMLSNKELADILRELPRRPLLAGEKGVRLSLAGVQDKLVVRFENNQISLPLNESPSTHLIKPAHSTYDDIIYNEAFCLNLARSIGLPAVKAEIKQVEDIKYLLIERYDRETTYPGGFQNIQRLHQEDLCQALGILPENKYQHEGGPSIQQCFNLLRTFSTVPVTDINKMRDIIIYNFIIGNCDAHGKNFALLYSQKKQIQLASFYDLISTVYYPELDKKMAMKLGGEYRSDLITLVNFEKMAEEAGLGKAAVSKRVMEMCAEIKDTLRAMKFKYPIDEPLSHLIVKRCENMLGL